jgi:hypothetical protein
MLTWLGGNQHVGGMFDGELGLGDLVMVRQIDDLDGQIPMDVGKWWVHRLRQVR